MHRQTVGRGAGGVTSTVIVAAAILLGAVPMERAVAAARVQTPSQTPSPTASQGAGQSSSVTQEAAAPGPEGPTPEMAARYEALVKATGLSMEQLSPRTWGVTFKGEKDDTIDAYVTFSETIAVVRSVAAEAPDLTAEAMRKALTMSYLADFAKASIDDEGDLVALQELELSTVTGAHLKETLQAVASLAVDLSALAPARAPMETRSPLTASSTSSTSSISVPFVWAASTLRMDGDAWKADSPSDVGDNVQRRTLQHRSGEVFAALIEERSELGLEQVMEASVVNAREAASEVRVLTRGTREVNGRRLGFIEMDATIDGMMWTFYNHFFSDRTGTVQVVGWTPRNLIDTHRATIESLVSGFQARQ